MNIKPHQSKNGNELKDTREEYSKNCPRATYERSHPLHQQADAPGKIFSASDQHFLWHVQKTLVIFSAEKMWAQPVD